MNTISNSFELRYFSQDPLANGETDFKGGTSVLNTQQRVDFLNEYAKQLEENLVGVDLSEPIVSTTEVESVLGKIKAQPVPEHRKRIPLQNWRWIGTSQENQLKQLKQVNYWQNISQVEIIDGCLNFKEDYFLNIKVPSQVWRCFLEWKIPSASLNSSFNIKIGEVIQLGFDLDSQLYYVSDHHKFSIPSISGDMIFKAEIDLASRKYNLFINNVLVADFVAFSDPLQISLSDISIIGKKGLKIDYIWGVSYQRLLENEFEPFSIETFIDEDFNWPIQTEGWDQLGYDDELWQQGLLPIVHGGERYAGQDILMRSKIQLDQVPVYAEISIESITPGGELYINGRLAELVKDEYPHKLDVTKFLNEGENLFAIKVYHDKIQESEKMTHTHTDLYTGWFAGRMYLDLLPSIFIEDVFTWTESLGECAAFQRVKVSVKTLRGLSSAKVAPHKIRVSMRPWFPIEGDICAEGSWMTQTSANLVEVTEGTLEIIDPRLWTCQSPELYKIVVELYDSDEVLCDDYIVTAGIRTVSQEGGIFRINGQPELLRAPLLFGARPPMENIAAWEKCPPAQCYIEEMMMVKKMNGNGIRMSVHDERMGGINDPRICEFADQLGIMLIWQTSAWLRLTACTNLDLEGMITCIRQVRNHCSIVIWQPTNHPSWKSWDTVMLMYRKIYEAILPQDNSRLISPSADSRRLNPYNDSGTIDYKGNPVNDIDPIWTAPLICRGNMDYILGYGNEWPALRQWPNVDKQNLPIYMDTTDYIQSFIESKERAYFNFEHDETAGQPNWDLHKGKPTYQVKSYEWRYEEGSIGRELDFHEWKTSQAWQAFEAYEVIRKSRWLDYDGFSWCCLKGGPNTATYQKSLVDYYGQPKLVYYAHQMVFQNVLAGSGNVDVVYGPDDEIPVMVLNLGARKKVEICVEIVAPSGEILERKSYPNVELEEGRTVTYLESFKTALYLEGLYSVQYSVKE